jgi:hypothetical protein
VEDQKPVLSIGRASVPLVETRDPVGQRAQEILVLRQVLTWCVLPVCQEREVEMAVGIRQVVDLESLDRLLHVLAAREQRGYDHHGAKFRRHTIGEVELSEQAWSDDRGHQAMDEGHRDVGGGHHREDAKENEDRNGCACAPGQEQRAGEDERGEDGDASEVSQHRMGAKRACDAGAPGDPVAQALLERPPATRQEVISRILLGALGHRVPLSLAASPSGRAGQLHGLARHLELSSLRSPGQHLHLCPVHVARGEIHRGEPRNGSEHFVHHTDALEKLGPVDGGEPPHAGDDVADRDVRLGLRLVCLGYDLVGGRPLRSKVLVEPVEGGRDGHCLVTKPLDQLHGERAGQRGVTQATQNLIDRLRRSTAETQKPVRHLVGPGAGVAGTDHRLREPPQVFQQRHPKVDGDGPELPDAERLDVLVHADESPQRFQLEPTVGMGHVGPGQPVDARIPLEVTLGDLGQQAVEAPREVIPDLPVLFVHDEEVVENPLFGRRDLALLPNRFDDVSVCGQECASVLADPPEEIPSFGGLLGGALGRRQALGVFLEALDTEHLGADRLVHWRRSGDDGVGYGHEEVPTAGSSET